MKVSSSFSFGGGPRRFVLVVAIMCLGEKSRMFCQAWGKVGHEMIGNLAWQLLDADIQEVVRHILNVTSTNTTITQHKDDDNTTLTPLGAVADWADTVRHTHAYAWSGPLHYIDVRNDACDDHDANHRQVTTADCSDFVWSRDCPDDWCVAGAIQNYTSRLLLTPTTTDPLKFVTHFVGDMHQPLHVSRTTDRGGNNISVHTDFHAPTTDSTHLRLRRLDTRTTHHHTNLHGVWDDVLIETYQKENCHNDWTEMQGVVWDMITQASHSDTKWHQWTQCANGGRHVCVDTWAQESWDLAKHAAYIHVNGTQIQPNDTLPREYYEQRIPVVMEQLAKAAVRLAFTLTVHLSDAAAAADDDDDHGNLLDSVLLSSTTSATPQSPSETFFSWINTVHNMLSKHITLDRWI
mmetsp:Transcript_2106/g.4580  ORF Transcript_2106/g.4580 Transcript_2106/m.4580 type:complete len:406 (+) Transcript_2106:148-1365(+)